MDKDTLYMALESHGREILGVPLSVEDITVRFMIYSGLLLNPPYNFSMEEIQNLLNVAKNVKFNVQQVNKSNAN